MRSNGASELDVQSSTGVTFENVQSATRNSVEDWLRGFGVDQFGATEVMRAAHVDGTIVQNRTMIVTLGRIRRQSRAPGIILIFTTMLSKPGVCSGVEASPRLSY